MTFTEQQCKDVGITLGMPEDRSLSFYHHYNAQNWLYPYNLPITNLKSAMWRWQQNQYKFDKSGNGKTKLYPIKGKICSQGDCRMPAVYKDSTGAYDSYACSAHLSAKVKEKYE